MKTASMTKEQKNVIRKELVFSNIISEQMKANKNNIQERKSVHRLLSGKVVKQYRAAKQICSKTGLNKNSMSRNLKASSQDLNKSREIFQRKYENAVLHFMERDDNSRCQPGKADVRKDGNEKKQVRVLTDYLGNLHKYLSENPESQVSLATFCRIRPKYIQLCSFISRNICLCTKHQNMVLTIRALRKEGIMVPTNPEKLANVNIDIASLEDKLGDTITFSQWKRVDVHEKDRQKSVMRIVSQTESKQEFLSHLDQQKNDFEKHVNRVKTQYQKIRHLKQNLPAGHVLLHMDFAKNYSCKSLDEIQSAYWNQTGVTLHPVDMYYHPSSDDDVEHQSFVLVSATQSHNATTVLSFIDAIMPDIKMVVPNLEAVHYWTYSPTSQYRNKLIFDTVAHHKEIYNCFATWNFFESGHGKGPCDGLGGTVKRMADQAIKMGKAVIQYASDFFQWAVKSSMSNIRFKYVPESVINEKSDSLKNTLDVLVPVKGTMKVHAIMGHGKGTAFVRETSCYCRVCITNISTCDTWKKVVTRKALSSLQSERVAHESEKPVQTHYCQVQQADVIDVIPSEVAVDNPGHIQHADQTDVSESDVAVDNFIAAIYDEQWYIGKIVDVDSDDNEVEISFMEKKQYHFQWPRKADIVWIERKGVLCTFQQPVPTGKSGRMLNVSVEDMKMIEHSFETSRMGPYSRR